MAKTELKLFLILTCLVTFIIIHYLDIQVEVQYRSKLLQKFKSRLENSGKRILDLFQDFQGDSGLDLSAGANLATNVGNGYTPPEPAPPPPPEPAHQDANSFVFNKQSLPADFELKRLLNTRKLILFAIDELNARLAETKCFKYWANPLNVAQIVQQKSSTDTLPVYRITFMIEPGHQPFEVIIERNKDRKKVYDIFEFGQQNELRLISSKLMNEDNDPSGCIELSSDSNSEICTCPINNNNTQSLLNNTVEAGVISNSTDPELKAWPPSNPMFFTNYFSYDSKELYLRYPDNAPAKYCDASLKMIIMMSSMPGNFNNREAIGVTFGNRVVLGPQKAALVFVIGKPDDLYIQGELSKEMDRFGDIILVNITDSPYNGTLRDLATFNWILQTCQGISIPEWTLKADDNFFINVDLALKIAVANPDIPLLGFPICSKHPNRNPASDEYTPKYIFAPDTFPCHLFGSTYMIQSSWILKLLQASLSSPLINFHDLYLTGILPLEIGLCPTGFPTKFYPIYNSKRTTCELMQTVSLIFQNNEELNQQWKDLNDPSAAKCRVDFQVKVTAPEPTDDCIFTMRGL